MSACPQDIAAPQSGKFGRSQPIVFFDGDCGLCQKSIQFLLDHDTRGALLYAPLQGETAARLLPVADREILDSLVLYRDGTMWKRSSAVARLLWLLPGVWPALGTVLWLVPRFLRDFGYKVVARNRIRWFGGVNACRMPRPGERERILD